MRRPWRRQVSTDPPARPARILHICRRYVPFPGGTERYVRDLATTQARAGKQVTVLTLDHDTTGGRSGRSGRLPASERIDGVDILRVPGWGTRQFAVTFRPDLVVRSVLAHDVVHAHDLRFSIGIVAATAFAARRPWILHTHGLIFHNGAGSRLKRAVMRMYFGPLLRAGGARVIASSGSDRSLLLRDAPYLDARVVTFDNAIPLEPLIGLSRDPIPGRIVAVGRIVQSKGLADLLAALALVGDENWTLEIAGEPDQREVDRLSRQALQAGIQDRVHVRGAFSDSELLQLLSSASAAAFSSRGEGFGIALLEAMAAGVPLCARRIPAHELLLGPELAFLLADFSNPTETATRIAALLALSKDEVQKLSTRLRERASSYDIGRLGAQIDGLYEQLGLLRRGAQS